MAQVPINPFVLLRRSYAVAAENLRAQGGAAAAAVMRKVATEAVAPSSGVGVGAEKKEIFWMRDPDTGNWIPETHFGDQINDAAELREKLLPKNYNKL